MQPAGEHPPRAARSRVDPLNDPNRLSKLIPGLEKLDMLAPDEFAGTLNVGIAAVKGVYTGELKLEDIRPPKHYSRRTRQAGLHARCGHARPAPQGPH